jgi:hypothetical protein
MPTVPFLTDKMYQLNTTKNYKTLHIRCQIQVSTPRYHQGVFQQQHFVFPTKPPDDGTLVLKYAGVDTRCEVCFVMFYFI